MGTIKQLAGQTAVYGMSSILGRILNYLLVPLYTRVFLPHEAAVYVELYAYMAFLAVVLTYGMETAFFRYSETGKDAGKVYSTTLFSVFFSTLLFLAMTLVFRDTVANILGYQGQTEYIIWFALILGLDALSAIPFAWLRARNKALRFAIIKLVNIGINISFNLLLIVVVPWLFGKTGFGWLSHFSEGTPRVSSIFISNFLASLVTLVLLVPAIRNAAPVFDTRLWKNMFRYAFPLLIFGLAGIVNETIDRILLRHLLPPETAMHSLGIYGMCFKISVFIVIFIQAFRYAAEPFFFKQAARKDAPETYARVMNYFSIVCFLMFSGIMLFMDVVKHFVGPGYHDGLPIVPMLLMGHVFLGIFYNLSVWYKITGKTRYGAWISLAGVGVTIGLNILLIPLIGFMGSAWANLGCYTLMMVLSYTIGQKHYPIPYDLKKFFLYLVLSVGIWQIGEAMPFAMQGIRLFVNGLLFVLFGGFILYNEPELRMMLQLFIKSAKHGNHSS
jgi:O-antigen/teichoic acid export membrane protein